jgi:hypothetical protein
MFSVVQGHTVSLDFVVTHWTDTTPYGSIALLAHNWSAGEYFDDIEIEDILITIDSNGYKNTYIVTDRIEYATGFNNEEVFQKIYVGKRLVLQTCTDNGLLFIIALPVDILNIEEETYFTKNVKYLQYK